jgi:hypothetical protein
MRVDVVHSLTAPALVHHEIFLGGDATVAVLDMYVCN